MVRYLWYFVWLLNGLSTTVNFFLYITINSIAVWNYPSITETHLPLFYIALNFIVYLIKLLKVVEATLLCPNMPELTIVVITTSSLVVAATDSKPRWVWWSQVFKRLISKLFRVATPYSKWYKSICYMMAFLFEKYWIICTIFWCHFSYLFVTQQQQQRHIRHSINQV